MNWQAKGDRAKSDEIGLPVWKRRLFTLVMLLVPVFFFAGLEGTLRLVGYGDTYPLFVPVEGYPGYVYQNPEVARRYFAHLQNVPTGLHDFFEAEKSPETLRIFVQGGSSAAGYPFYYGGAFSRMLEQRLMQTFPERRIEVVNTAMAAVNSYTLLDFVDEIIAHEPDAVLIYAGHNEYYGALGVGSSETLGRIPALTRWYLRLRRWRTVHALRDVLAGAAGLVGSRSSGEPPSHTLMERMVGEQSIPYGSTLFEQGLRQFRSNLALILARYQEHGIPVFIGTLASNERDHAPFISGLSGGTDEETWNALYRRARATVERGAWQEALVMLDTLITMDSLAADPFYLRGRVLERLGRYAEARTSFLFAKDRDELRFRAPEAMNQIIREEAARYDAVVVETREALAAASPYGIIGSNLMMEHLHPNVDGYFRIADAFYEKLRERDLAWGWERYVSFEEARAEVLLTPVDSLVGTYRVRRLIASWPFQPPGVVDRSLDTLKAGNPVEQIALDLYRRKIGWREANDALRRYYEAQGAYHRALQAALAHVQEYPFLPQPYLVAGNILVRQHRFEEALAYFEAANELEESSLAETMIGSILLRRGDREAAVNHLERALELDADNVQALYNLAGAYALGGQYERARETVQRLLSIVPDHKDGRRLLASLPARAPE